MDKYSNVMSYFEKKKSYYNDTLPIKKIIEFPFFLLSILMFLASCDNENNDPVRACFNMSADTIIVGDKIEFYNCSDNATTFLWDFGDNNTSKKREPNHIFEKTGSYEIELLAGEDLNMDGILDMNDKTDSISKTVIVIPKNEKSIELTIRNAKLWTPENPTLDPALEGAIVNLYTSQNSFDNNTPDYTSTSDKNGKAIFYNLPADTYFLIVNHEDLSNIASNGFLIIGVFQTQEEVDNSAAQPNNPKPGSLKYADVNGDGRIDSFDHVQFETITLNEKVYVKDIVIGNE